MDGMHYIPWQGERYPGGVQAGLRLLILGDSFHDQVGAPGFPAQVVGEFMDGQRNYPFFAAIQRVVTGRSATDLAGRQAFWHSVAFSNMVQEPMATAASAPTPAQWRRAWACFPGLAAALAPDVVFFFTRRGWTAEGRTAPGHPPGHLLLAPEHKTHAAGFARLRVDGGRPMLCGCFYHPRFMSRNKEDEAVWHRWAARLLAEAPGLLARPGHPRTEDAP